MADHVRQHRSLLAPAEKRALVWMARRLPPWINSDHLSAIGLVSMGAAGLSFWYASINPAIGLGLVVVSLVANWFGDSLDGTLARVRDQQRPRYGYYVDHVIDLAGTAMLFAGLAASGFMTPIIATLVVASFFLVSAEAYLATHARGVFNMAFLGIGPTELRILLAIGALFLINSPVVNVFSFGEAKLFDIGGIAGTIGMVITFVVTSANNVRTLYAEEPLR